MNELNLNKHAWMVRGGPPNAAGKYRVVLCSSYALAESTARELERAARESGMTATVSVIRRRVGDDWVRVGL